MNDNPLQQQRRCSWGILGVDRCFRPGTSFPTLITEITIDDFLATVELPIEKWFCDDCQSLTKLSYLLTDLDWGRLDEALNRHNLRTTRNPPAFRTRWDRGGALVEETREKKIFCVLARHHNIFRDTFRRYTGKCRASIREFETNDVIYKYCSQREHIHGLRFDGVLKIGPWDSGSGADDRRQILDYVRHVSGPALQEIEI